ncbi:hypothetical protein BJ742DRAFT_62829 [Cladochytrium replicatum]|nr:hypothetical protein BJ742DRAFT_62829 [Cladochytrium replicatum]
MERLAAFRFLLPQKVFRLVYTPLVVLGTILFLAMEASSILINVVPISDALVTSVVLCANLLIVVSILIEWVLSIALCRTFFIRTSTRSSRTETWSLARRAVQENVDFRELEDPDRKQNPFMPAGSTQDSASSVPSYPPPPLTSPKRPWLAHSVDGRSPDYTDRMSQQPILPPPRPSSTFVRRGSDAGSLYTLREAFLDPQKRRTMLLFCGFVFTDVLGFMFYGLGFFPDSEKMARPLEVVGRTAVGFHITLALIFLDSFKQLIHPDEMSTRVLTGRAPL